MFIEFAEPAAGFPSAPAVLITFALLIAILVAVAARRKVLLDLLSSDGTLAFPSGLLLFVSAFFVYAYGPWGVGFSPYTTFTWHWGLPKILYGLPSLWPQIMGVAMLIGAVARSFVHQPPGLRLSWYIVAAVLVAVPVCIAGTLLWDRFIADPYVRPRSSAIWVTTAIAITIIAAVTVAIVLPHTDRRRRVWIHQVAAAGLLIPNVIGFILTPSLSAVREYTLGSWLQLGGTLTLFAACLRTLLQSAPAEYTGLSCTHCGYCLIGNQSGRCPECGTPTEIKSL